MPPFLAKGLTLTPLLAVFAIFGGGWWGLIGASIVYLLVFR